MYALPSAVNYGCSRKIELFQDLYLGENGQVVEFDERVSEIGYVCVGHALSVRGIHAYPGSGLLIPGSDSFLRIVLVFVNIRHKLSGFSGLSGHGAEFSACVSLDIRCNEVDKILRLEQRLDKGGHFSCPVMYIPVISEIYSLFSPGVGVDCSLLHINDLFRQLF